MSKKFVLVPWERLQSLLALEKKDVYTDSAAGAGLDNDSDTSTVSATECITTHPQGGAAALQSNVTHHSLKDRAAVQDLQESPKLSGEPEGSVAVGDAEENQEQRGFGEEVGKKIESIEKNDLSLLRPPGEPARRWLTWN